MLTNLKDITLSDKFSTLLGYTEEELVRYFKDRITALTGTGSGPFQSVSEKELLASIRHWYNGYSWDGSHFVYNPHSILNFFDEKSFGNYWFSTATPTFLVNAIRKKRIDVKKYEYLEVDNTVFESYDIDHMEIASLLFQTGYLTVKKRTFAADGNKLYHLSYPNKEVRDSFLKHLLNEKGARPRKHPKKSEEAESLCMIVEEERDQGDEIENKAHENITEELEKNEVVGAEDYANVRGYIRDPLEPDYAVEKTSDRKVGITKAKGNFSLEDIIKQKSLRQFKEPQKHMLPAKKILILSANPKATSRMRFDEEIREIEEVLLRSKHQDEFEIKSRLAVRYDDIRRVLLDYEPQIVHFIGHGDNEGLKIEDEAGNARPISVKALSELFGLCSDHIESVILSACYSAPQANAVSEHIDYVIGMSDKIMDDAAIEFAVGFYDALTSGKSVEKAFAFGCNAIRNIYPDFPAHFIPVLIKRNDLEKKG